MGIYGPETFRTRDGRTLTIRHCVPDDVPAFLEFQPQVANETQFTLQIPGRTPEAEKIRESWASVIAEPKALRLGAFEGNKVVGQLMFYAEKSPAHPWTQHIGSFGMMILKDYWGQGIGQRLLAIMDDHARAHGISRIEAMVREKNAHGIRLYTRAGFTIEGTRQKAAFIDGEFQNEFTIAKILTSEKPWTPNPLETPRLFLRALTLEDAPAVFDYAKNPNVSRFTQWEPHLSIQDTYAFFADYVFPRYRSQNPEPFGIALKTDPGKIVGTVGCFWASRESRCLELAYAISEPLWGKGLVPEAAAATIEQAFRETNATRIQARCVVENTASARVMEKVGMTREGTLRSALWYRGRFWDMHLYALTR